MSTALATLAGKLAERVGMDSVDPQELITTLRQTAFKGDASDAQFIALLIVANQYGLNPWTKEIYAFPDKQNGIVPVVGVDGWSRIINENQQFDGMDFEQDNESCTCRIYRKDRNHPICVTEWMDECRREPFKTREGREITGPWQSHPKRMLRHKAMIQCARLAFGFAGIYDKDEAERIVENTAYTAERQPERDITPVTSRDFMKFRLGGFEAIKSAYMAQVQYSMWVTRKDAWYFANYDPRMKREGLHYVVIERDEKYMASFDEMVPEFIEKMDEALAEIGFVFGEQWR